MAGTPEAISNPAIATTNSQRFRMTFPLRPPSAIAGEDDRDTRSIHWEASAESPPFPRCRAVNIDAVDKADRKNRISATGSRRNVRGSGSLHPHADHLFAVRPP